MLCSVDLDVSACSSTFLACLAPVSVDLNSSPHLSACVNSKRDTPRRTDRHIYTGEDVYAHQNSCTHLYPNACTYVSGGISTYKFYLLFVECGDSVSFYNLEYVGAHDECHRNRLVDLYIYIYIYRVGVYFSVYVCF